MERFNAEELAPIQKALQAFTDPHQQAAALSKACRIAQQVDERIQAGVTIEAHPEADELTKAVIGAVQALAKREKGAPLSEAELKQRQEAARKKGDAVGTAARGAAAAGAGALVGATAARMHAGLGARGRKGMAIYARMVDRDLNKPSPDFNLPRANKFVRRGLAKPYARAGAAGAIAGAAIGAAVYGGKKIMDSRRAEKAAAGDLRKSDLSEAEHQQRVNAAKARWAKRTVRTADAMLPENSGRTYGASLALRDREGRDFELPVGRYDTEAEAMEATEYAYRQARRMGDRWQDDDAFDEQNPKFSIENVIAGGAGGAVLGGALSGIPAAALVNATKGRAAMPAIALNAAGTIGGAYLGGRWANRATKQMRREAEIERAELFGKAVASLPLAKRALAEGLMREGRYDELQKLAWLAPALGAARAALPSVARAAATVGGRLFGAGQAAGSATMAAGRAGIRGAAGAARGVKAGFGKVKGAWNATRNSRLGGAAGAAMNGIMAADAVASGAKAAGNWAKQNKRTIGMTAGGLAGGAGVGAAYGAGINALAERRANQPRY